MMRSVATSLLLCVTLLGCGRDGSTIVTEPPQEQPITVPVIENPVGSEHPAADVRYSQYSGFAARRRLVVRDAATWDAVWSQFVGSVTPRPDAPTVDFSTQMVLVATMGTKMSGGYSIVIERASVNGNDMLALVRETSPGRTCAVTGALTAPATAVIVPAVSGNVSFREAASTRDC